MAKREKIIQKLKDQLDVLNGEIDKLEAKGKQVDAKVRDKYAEQIAILCTQRDRAIKKIDQFQKSSGEAWKDLKKGADDVWQTMKETVTNARDKFK